jgi:hypothetical protein
MSTAEKVRRRAKEVPEATERLHEAMRQMREEGATLRAIGEAAGMSHVAVAKILAK